MGRVRGQDCLARFGVLRRNCPTPVVGFDKD
jgi:hypothetical protein